LLLALSTLTAAYDTSGVVSLDTRTFDKIVDGHYPVLVKVDKKWSTSTVYKELSDKVAESSTKLLLAEVAVSDYGEKDNEDLAKRFGISKEDFPAFMFFAQGSTAPLKYDGNTKEADDFIRWLKKNGVHLGLSGTVQRMDELAAEFMKSEVTRADVLSEAEKAAAELTSKLALETDTGKAEKSNIDSYIRVMKNVIKEGVAFVDKEVKRLEKLKGDKAVKADKRAMFAQRLNIVSSFSAQ